MKQDGYAPLEETRGTQSFDIPETVIIEPPQDEQASERLSIRHSLPCNIRNRNKSNDTILDSNVDISSDEGGQLSVMEDTISIMTDVSQLVSYKYRPAWKKLNVFNRSFQRQEKIEEMHFCSKLYHTKRHIFPLKDYHDEARAMRDIKKFLDHPIVLFKVSHSGWEEIVKDMVRELAREKPDLKLDKSRCLKSLCSKDADYLIPECIQGIRESCQGPYTDQSFITAIGNTNAVSDTQVVMALLDKPVNFGVGAEEIKFVCIVLVPTKGKHTKSGIEVGRTYSTLLADDRLRHSLLLTHTASEFAHEFEIEVHRIHKEHEKREREKSLANASIQRERKDASTSSKRHRFIPGRLIYEDFKRRIKWYLSDYIDDVTSCDSIQKMISATLFLYFSLLLPGIAFGVLNNYYTKGKIDSKNVIVSQALSGVLYSLFAGQPLVVVMTTIPLVIYTKVIYAISLNWDEDGDFFYTLYTMTGLSNAAFLAIYAVTGASNIMTHCSRSTEEIMGLFISLAFIVDTVKYILKEFGSYYCFDNITIEDVNGTVKRAAAEFKDCDPAKPMLSLLLILITVYIGVQIFRFKYSPYLNAGKRVLVADYALVVAVLAGSLVGSYGFSSIPLQQFEVNEERGLFSLVSMKTPTGGAVLTSMGLGFLMSILFFMEGNISASIVTNPQNKLKKGTAFHLDMLVIALINAALSIFGLPWVHGALPHSPLHVRALADIEEHVDNGHLTETIVYVRETRLTTLVSHILIGASIFMIPYPLNLIPIPVLYGLFLFLSLTSLGEFQMWERLVLIFTEQNLYPPIHYVRKVPQKIIHCFTFIQLLQLMALCAVSFGNNAYLKMFFPFIIILLMPIREKILPKLISDRYLDALDGEH